MLTVNFSKATFKELLKFCHGTFLIMIFVKKLIKRDKRTSHGKSICICMSQLNINYIKYNVLRSIEIVKIYDINPLLSNVAKWSDAL